MASRDATFDLVARDKTSPGIRSVEGNLKRASREAERTGGVFAKAFSQFTKSGSAIRTVSDQWGRGFSRIGQAAKRWSDSGSTSGNRFVRGVSQGVGSMLKVGAKVGGLLFKGFSAGLGALSEAGSLIGKNLSNAIQAAGPYAQVAMAGLMGLVVLAAAAAAPAIGAVIGGAIVGGAGIGGMVGGLILAAKDPRVSGAFSSLQRDVSRMLGDAAESFGPAALDAVRIARGAFQNLMPDLRRIFNTTSTFVAPLTRSLGRAAQSALSGIAQAVEKAGPIINAVGEGVEEIGRAIGSVFRDLSDNGASMAIAVRGAFGVVAGAIRGFGIGLNILVETFEAFINIIPGGKALLERYAASSNTAAESSKGLAGGLRGIGTDSAAAANGLADVRAKAQELADSNISFREAQIAAKNATAEATAALKENGKAKGTNTQKGRENEAALNAMATAFNNEATAGERSGISANDASNAYHNNRAALVKMAEKAGYSRTEANKLAAQLLKIPKNVNTTINADTSTATSKLVTFQKQVNGLRGKTVTVRVQSSGDHYIPGVGTQLKGFASTGSWSASDGAGTHRSGGPTKTEMTLTNNIYLDGQFLYSYVDKAIAGSERKQNWHARNGRR
ncbi:hypothetical protein [Micromonospora sp. C81]|uniref:hypothetical protein n=1 Tax=Micromonospora sp. C81 TaxID=2824881 RepID=UPI001B38A26A|nr:hypothetical protein [Micromonospora sp. C81]MBQ1039287.1 hypothetical protein [Micromonospora sp. C81]